MNQQPDIKAPTTESERRSTFHPPRHIYATQGSDGHTTRLSDDDCPEMSRPTPMYPQGNKMQHQFSAEENATLYMYGQGEVATEHMSGEEGNRYSDGSMQNRHLSYNEMAGGPSDPTAGPADEHWSILCLMQKCTSSFARADHLQRALCFGAIDGMVTGAGIVAACAGLGLFHPYYTPLSQRLMVVVMCFAACASDGIGMSLGHIFSTHILHHRAAREREQEQWMFDQYRSVSKAKLVDLLLQRGMLKIDAMSVADTLEGYPDIFVNAIVGDAAGAGPIGLGDGAKISEDIDVASNTPSNDAHAYERPHQHAEGFFGMIPGPEPHAKLDYGSSEPAQPRTSLYKSDYDDDGEDNDRGICCGDEDGRRGGHGGDDSILKESRKEGLVMMISFSAFSILPGFIYGFVPVMLQPELANSTQHHTTGMSCASFAITSLSAIILVMGIWKR
jgi:hypothetical protein